MLYIGNIYIVCKLSYSTEKKSSLSNFCDEMFIWMFFVQRGILVGT